MARRKDRDGIRQLGPHRFQVVLDLGRDSDGKRHREYKNVHGTYEDAKAVRAQLMADKARGEFVRRSDQGLSDFLEDWLAWNEPFLSERNWVRYDEHLHKIMRELGTKQLQDLTPQDLEAYYARCLKEEPGQRRGSLISPTTIHARHVVLKMALDKAVELGLLVKNPARLARPPRRAKPQTFVLDESQCALLLAATESAPSGLQIRLALMSGAREGEILGLRWSDIDFVGSGIHICHPLAEHRRKNSDHWYYFKDHPKSGKRRFVDLDADTLERLEAHRREQLKQRLAVGTAYDKELDLVFATPLGAPIRPSSVSAHFRSLARSLGFDTMRYHDTRHTHATLLLKAGVPPHVVSERLGHSTVAFTLDRYAWVLPGQQREAAEGFAARLSAASSSATGSDDGDSMATAGHAHVP